MFFYGIICEFNPFHDGHRYLIRKTREITGADGIVCAMSGSMVQRGDVAIFDKWSRAEAAIEGGADLVIELPACYVLQSSDIFAYGGVALLSRLGVRGLSFGSECDNLSLLKKAARVRLNEPPEYKEAFAGAINSGFGYPAACEAGLRACLGDISDELTRPNCTLAISYIKAALELDSNLEFTAVKRIGDYHSKSLNSAFPSATAIRSSIMNIQANRYKDTEVYNIEKLSALILGFFRTADLQRLNNISGMEPGLAGRMISASRESASVSEFVEKCTSKRYTAHRIRRVMLCSVLGITGCEEPGYIRVLALNDTGAQILKNAKKNTALSIVTKTSDYKYKPGDMFSKDILATDIAALCCGKKASRDFTQAPFVLKKG